jgi:hypothetical protein
MSETAAFYVEYSDDPDIGDEVPKEGFDKHAEALRFAKRQAEGFRCVWIREMGKYNSRRGGEKHDWMYFWTTPDTEFGTEQVRGLGIPREGDLADLDEIAQYTPLRDWPETDDD